MDLRINLMTPRHEFAEKSVVELRSTRFCGVQDSVEIESNGYE